MGTKKSLQKPNRNSLHCKALKRGWRKSTERERDIERKTEKDRKTETERERETETDRKRQTGRDRQRQRWQANGRGPVE